jgi:guanylate kinase
MNTNIPRRGLMLVLSSPSGAGKTTLSRGLLASDSQIVLSVSATTRKKRSNESEGRDYFFVSRDGFDAAIDAGEFLEYATVFDHLYGTPKKPVMDALAAGQDVLFDIDWQGTQQLKERAREDLVSVFVLPPTHDELERRLRIRAQEYDYVIVNDDLALAQARIKAILDAERLRRTRQVGLSDFVRKLT